MCGSWRNPEVKVGQNSRVKIDRAREHRAALDAEISQWKELPDPIMIIGAPSATNSSFTVTIRVVKPFVPRLGAIFGDEVNNLQGALDMLIHDLVVADGGVPHKSTSFPVCTEASKWSGNAASQLKGLSEDHIAAIQDLQPFITQGSEGVHPLDLLARANNINKHRLITPVAISHLEAEPRFTCNRPLEKDDVIEQTNEDFDQTRNNLEGQIIARFIPKSKRGDLRILATEPSVRCFVGVGFQGLQAIGEYPDMIACVDQIVGRFETN
jgi:hypothetical protein